MLCDWGHEAVEVRRLEMSEGAGVFLCQKHWATEMAWRMERNKDLAPENRFDIIHWLRT